MVQKIRQIGNSKGIIIPKTFIDTCSIKEEVKISVKNGSIIISPLDNSVRNGWREQFEKALQNNEVPDNSDFEVIINEFDSDEW